MKNRLTLQDVEWKEFKISDLFDINIRGRRLTQKNREIGNIPFVTAGESNNGISDFICNKNQTEYFDSITLDMFGNTFYQSFKFKCDDNITVLNNRNLNKYSKLFIVAILQGLKKKYSYGNQIRPNRLKQDKIMLPIDEQGNPNWKFMEDYIKQEQKEMTSKIVKYYQNKLDEILQTVTGGGGH